MLLSIVDATEQMRHAALDRIVLGELKHRIRNTLATARANARLTSTEGRTAQQYRDALLARLRALVEAHEIVLGDTPIADLSSLAERILAPYFAGGGVRIGDPPMSHSMRRKCWRSA